MEEVIHFLKKHISFPIWYKLYADDLVFIVKHENLADLILKLEDTSKKFSLIINKKKSAVIPIKNHLRDEIDSFIEYPIL